MRVQTIHWFVIKNISIKYCFGSTRDRDRGRDPTYARTIICTYKYTYACILECLYTMADDHASSQICMHKYARVYTVAYFCQHLL